MSTEKYVPKLKPAHQVVAGVIIPKYQFTAENFLAAINYKPTPDDIFIVSYPKSGTTWTQYIVWEILNFGASPPNMNDMLNKCVPFLEFTGPGPVAKLKPPRAIKTHFPFHINPYHSQAKYIYIARNPKDCCISYYNHTKEISSVYRFSEGTLDDFFECFLDGELGSGHWFEHVLSWYEHRNDPNVLFLTYENMKRDPAGNILIIAEFLGKKYHQTLVEDPNLLARIVEYTSFETMRKLEFYMPKEGADVINDGEFSVPKSEEEAAKFKKVNFFWRGKVGNWKEYLSEEQVERLNEMVRSRRRGREIATLFQE